ncbi:hypothetical protein B0H34DRAFT_646329 [Crassisporium funariophilum]|nr:hypothetical protein B0H34DRAFT_646329 [Crassisporium funariophilum]
MDVDGDHIHKYDDYVRGPAREVITVETKLKPSNKGFAMLAKLGWVEGQPVGLSADGRTEPIPFYVKKDSTGLGKTSQDVRMIETTVSQRRELDSERQQKENEEQRRLREDVVARKNALETEISSTLRAFYCSLCDKQFKTVAQYDEHTNSYAHHHKARFKDMQANVRIKPKEELDKQKEKERKREEKELRKIAAANGIKMPKQLTATTASALAPVSGSADMDVDGTPIEPKIGGWASLSTPQVANTTTGSQTGFKKSGWATVGPSSSSSSSFTSSSTPATDRLVPPSSTSVSGHGTAAGLGHNPTFRNAGWTSLDTGSSQPNPAPHRPPDQPYQDHLPPREPAASSQQGGWSRGFSSTSTQFSGGSSSIPSREWQGTFDRGQGLPPPPPPSEPTAAQPPPPQPPPSPPPTDPPVVAKPARSNWQQFQKGVSRRK